MIVATKIQRATAMEMRTILDFYAVALEVWLLGPNLHGFELSGEDYSHGKAKSCRMISQMAAWIRIARTSVYLFIRGLFNMK
jgi:hypothetical protein